MLFKKPSFSPTRALIAASLCFASVLSVHSPAVAACSAADPGCVLPIGQAPPPVTQPPPAPIVDEDGGIGWLPILIGLAALAALLFLLLDGDGEEAPISP